MKTVHEWMAERMAKNEGLWLNDKNAVVGMSNINPLLQKKAKVKPLKLPKAKLGVVKTPKPFKAMATAAFKPRSTSLRFKAVTKFPLGMRKSRYQCINLESQW
jgi:hypothetical protein